MLLVGGYFVLRFLTRKRRLGRGHPQSLFIAALTLGWVLADAVLVGLPRALGLAFALTGAVLATLFLLTIVDDLRVRGLRLQGEEQDDGKPPG